MNSSPQNCVRSSEKYWLFSPIDLITNFEIFPSSSMSLDSKLNSILRLCLIVFIVLIAIGYRLAILFLIISLLANLIFYYSFRHLYQ